MTSYTATSLVVVGMAATTTTTTCRWLLGKDYLDVLYKYVILKYIAIASYIIKVTTV